MGGHKQSLGSYGALDPTLAMALASTKNNTPVANFESSSLKTTKPLPIVVL